MRERLPGRDAESVPGRPRCWPTTRRLTVFATVHAQLLTRYRRQSFVTAVSSGRGFGVNIVCGGTRRVAMSRRQRDQRRVAYARNSSSDPHDWSARRSTSRRNPETPDVRSAPGPTEFAALLRRGRFADGRDSPCATAMPCSRHAGRRRRSRVARTFRAPGARRRPRPRDRRLPGGRGDLRPTMRERGVPRRLRLDTRLGGGRQHFGRWRDVPGGFPAPSSTSQAPDRRTARGIPIVAIRPRAPRSPLRRCRTRGSASPSQLRRRAPVFLRRVLPGWSGSGARERGNRLIR